MNAGTTRVRARSVAELVLPSVAVIVLYVFLYASATQGLEFMLFNLWFRIRGPVSPPSEIVIVGVDKESFQKINANSRLPFPRDRLAEAILKIKEAGATGVVADLLFSEPDSNPNGDLALAEALSSLPTILGMRAEGLLEDSSTRRLKEYTLEEAPIEMLSKRAFSLGSTEVPNSYGVLRLMPYRHVEFNGKPVPPMGEAAARLLRQVENIPRKGDFINYYGPAGSFATFSLWEVLMKDSQWVKHEFAGKLVFIGDYQTIGKAPGAFLDAHDTPYFGGRTFGVEILATIAANIVSQNWIRRVPEWLEAGGIISFLALFIFFASLLPPLTAFLSTLLLINLWAIACYQAFLHGYYAPGFATGSLCLLVVITLRVAWSLFITQRSRNQVRKVLSHVVAKPVMAELLKDPSKLVLGGQRSELTIMFTDIAGFSALAEKGKDEDLFGLISRYFSELYPTTQAHGGSVLHFMADALLVVWGAPLPVPDGPSRAVQTALEIQEKLKSFCVRENLPLLKTRIGIHHGSCTVGNFGAKDHFTYTVIGDQVNIASRLEGLNKLFNSPILVSAEVKARQEEDKCFICLGSLSLPGREAPTEVYGHFLKPFDDVVVKRWNEALTFFSTGNWPKAREAFKQIANKEKRLEVAAEFYIEKISFFELFPLPAGWNGEIQIEKDERQTIMALVEKVRELKLKASG